MNFNRLNTEYENILFSLQEEIYEGGAMILRYGEKEIVFMVERWNGRGMDGYF